MRNTLCSLRKDCLPDVNEVNSESAALQIGPPVIRCLQAGLRGVGPEELVL